MIKITILTVLILISFPVLLLAQSGNSEAGLFYSTWGSGVMGGYNYTDDIFLGGDIASTDSTTTSSGSGASIKSESVIQTFNAFGRYYLRDLEFTDGLFGQAGLAFRNWSGKGSITEDSTKAKIASVKINWSPVLLVTGVGWHKVWGFGLSLSVAINAGFGGTRTIEYTENMSRFSESLKNDLEKKTDFPTNLVVYVGYSF
ncbi:MAG: hypothetical protein H8E38_00660 [SAR324 cluster bacterium]|nr:hypothetical protein [SAR324 cluster bacterium]